MGVINKSKIILGMFIPILAFLLMSHNTFAVIPKLIRNVSNVTLYRDNTSGTPLTITSINGSSQTPVQTFTFNQNAAFVRPSFNLNQTFQLSKSVHAKISLEINAAYGSDVDFGVYCPQGDYEQGIYISECLIRDIENNVIAWEGTNTFTFNNSQGTGAGGSSESSGATHKTYFLDLIIYHNSTDLFTIQSMPFRGRFMSFSATNNNSHFATWQINYTQNPMAFTYEDTDPIPVIEAQTIAINDNFQDLFDKLDELIDNQSQQQQQEQNAVSSIENQSTSDIQGSSSTQTTSLIGVMSSFVSALGNVRATSCNLTLAFPSFMGGSQTVNPCLGKDKAPAIVQAASSMLLIVFFLPLSIILLKMIYNEIRSWTSG